MRALRFGLGAAVIVVEAVVALALIFSTDTTDNPWITAGFAVSAGVLFAASGLVAMWRRPDNPTGRLLAAVGYTWFIGALTAATNDWVFTFGYVFSGAGFVAFTALALAFPSGRLTTSFERGLVVGAAVLLIGSTAVEAMLDPTPYQGCDACAQSSIVVYEAPTAATVIETVSITVGLLLIATILVMLARRWRRASKPLRKVLGPVLAAITVTLVVLSVALVTETLFPALERAMSAAFLAVFASVPLSFLYGILRTRLAKSASATMFVSLEEGVALRDAVAQALDDPSLTIAYWLDERQIWIDADGGRVATPEPTADRAVKIVTREGRPIAALAYDPALDEEPDVLDAIAAAAGLSLRNEGLRASLRAQYLFLETITDTAPSLLIAIGLDGRILNQNIAAVEAAGYDEQEDVRGLLFWDVFISREERDDVERRFFAAAPRFEPAQYENGFTNRRGETFVIAWRSAPLLDDSGAVVSVISGGTDITERKARELELERERDATTTVLQSIPSAVAVLAPDGTIRDRDVDNPLAAVNRAFHEALGWRDDDLVHRSFLDVVAPRDREAAHAAIELAARGRASPAVESGWLTADGREIVFEWTAAPVADVTGRTDGLVLVSGNDVTERRRQEAEIRASRARLVKAGDDARRRLERNLHDGAQQRLVSVSVSLRLAETRLRDDPGQAATVLAEARAELASALEELRELARGIHPAVLTDRGLVAAVDALVARSPVPVTADIEDIRLTPEIEAAAYYVISESLTNVAKYARASQVRVQVAQTPETITIAVADDGVGGADPAGGSGLRGLTDRLAALDGTLAIESPPGGGTRVLAAVPRGAEAPAAPAAS